MRAPGTVRAGMLLAAIAVGLVSAGCFPAGPPAAASLTVTPSQVMFDSNPFPNMPTVAVTVTNTGGRSARPMAVTATGATGSIFSYPQPPMNACFGPMAVGMLAPGQSCVIDVQFCPTVMGSTQDTLVVTGQDVAGPMLQATAMLSGTTH